MNSTPKKKDPFLGKNVLILIETMRNTFTKTEIKIATYVLENPQNTIYMSLTEVSDTIKVSEGSIVRFCQKLGFTGFHPFKLSLAISEKDDYIGPLKEKTNLGEVNISDIKNYVTSKNIEVIKESTDFISEDSLENCVQRIIETHSLVLSGTGSSGNTVNDAFYKFMRIGINCKISRDIHLQAMMASQLGKKDTLLSISQSGSTLEIVDIAKIAKNSGATVIAITGYARSPLAGFADYVLLTPTRESPFESGALRAKIAQLHVLELLFTAVYMRRKKISEKNIERTASAVAKWIY